VDAIIVQDQAVGALVREFFPTLRIHASTQMAVHNLQGVVKAAELGYQRVVLAREVTAKEMKDIRAGVPSGVAELEAFVHGSLCYSYSGLCFFSGETDARSGNRGECAYTCRQPYTLTSEDGMGFLFSMADLDTSHDLDLLAEAGIDTLKVEGRKKGEGARAHAGHWWTHLSL
jgi:putative protease